DRSRQADRHGRPAGDGPGASPALCVLSTSLEPCPMVQPRSQLRPAGSLAGDLRPDPAAVRRFAGTCGGSDASGREELDEFWPSRASNSRMRCCRTAYCAGSAAFSGRSVANCSRRGAGSGAGTIAHRSGSGARGVSIMPRWYRTAGGLANPRPCPQTGGLNAYRLPIAAVAARQVTSTIPVVSPTGDLVGVGLAASLARPGGNVTGLTSISPQLSGKRVELLKEAVPGVSRVAVLWNPGSA